jgi:hypothetical protein
MGKRWPTLFYLCVKEWVRVDARSKERQYMKLSWAKSLLSDPPVLYCSGVLIHVTPSITNSPLKSNFLGSDGRTQSLISVKRGYHTITNRYNRALEVKHYSRRL